MTDIGTGAAALVCTTTYIPCCTSFNNPETQWYFPNGSRVSNDPSLPYQRTRREYFGRVILSRNSNSTITGIFHCDIPDVNGVIQSFYVGIYDDSTGESCILSEWLVICKEASSTPDKDSTFSSAYHLCSTYHTSGTPCGRGGIIMFNIATQRPIQSCGQQYIVGYLQGIWYSRQR